MISVVTVIVPTYQRPDLLADCLEALARQQLPGWVTAEVLVVSDGPDPAVAQLTQQVSQQTGLRIGYLHQPQRSGPAAARNRGWQATESPFIAFTDDDCRPEPTWLRAGVADLARGAQVLTGRVRMPLPDLPTHDERTSALLEKAEFVTANLFCRRAALVRVGGFCEEFDTAWREDSDLHFKLLEAGIPISTCPEAVVVHPLRRAPWYAPLTHERKNRYDALLYKRHPTLFRQRIPAYRKLVLRYYGAVFGLLAGLLTFAMGYPWLALPGIGCWIALTGWLVIDRLRASAIDEKTVKRAVVLSLATPFLSIYWRLYGAFTHRVWFW